MGLCKGGDAAQLLELEGAEGILPEGGKGLGNGAAHPRLQHGIEVEVGPAEHGGGPGGPTTGGDRFACRQGSVFQSIWHAKREKHDNLSHPRTWRTLCRKRGKHTPWTSEISL